MPAAKNNKYNLVWTKPKIKKLADEMIDWLNEKDEDGEDKGNIFFEEFLIIKKGLYRELIQYLSAKSDYFKNTVSRAKEIQELKLIKFGVADRLQSTMTIFCLKNHHGYKDSHQLDHTSNGEKFGPTVIAQSKKQQKKINDLLSKFDKE